ncbi:hypothetical protein [Telluribacter sp. SYSU D00476]|uniref:hypothetical protein n=1 Tax=Telluribacter sp. SYSU D00476 TaxID=2811430 RepID=UPI001FF55B79|nr:hypothetical protein [Telluribacter sp. SYSU D00476]
MTAMEKETLKKSLLHLAQEEPDFLRELLLEVKEDLKKARRKRLEEIVEEDFREYDEVFKALA